MSDQKKLQHIAIIMDGNRRWARARHLPEIAGHEHVVNHVLEELVDTCISQEIPYLTVWAFSTENWNRSENEVKAVLNLFRKAFEKNIEDLHKKGVRLLMIGDLTRFPVDIQKNVEQWIEMSRQNTRLTLTIALNYGGRDEILRGMKKISTIDELQSMNSETFSQKLDTVHIPDPDLLIRPGGEQRLSGFMLWQIAYSELYFSEILMPDFGSQQLLEVIQEFHSRKRRWGR